MNNFIVQSILSNARRNNRDVMTAYKATQEILSDNSDNPYDLTLDDKAYIALYCYEEAVRADKYYDHLSDILGFSSGESDVESMIIKLIKNDNDDSRDDLVTSIKQSFVTAYETKINDLIEDVLADCRSSAKYYDYNEDQSESDFYDL